MFDHRMVVKEPWSCPLLTSHMLAVGQLRCLAHPKDVNSTHGIGTKGKTQRPDRPMSPSGPDFGDKFLHPTRHTSWFYFYWGFLLLLRPVQGSLMVEDEPRGADDAK